VALNVDALTAYRIDPIVEGAEKLGRLAAWVTASSQSRIPPPPAGLRPEHVGVYLAAWRAEHLARHGTVPTELYDG
jgi:hypothetical protein